MKIKDSLLKWNNGVMSNGHFSFPLPENFYFHLGEELSLNSNILEFSSQDKIIHIEVEIGYREETAEEYFEEDESLKKSIIN